ncbi:transcriptional regulator [Burkholderia gladioli]|uniref:transcriptional regulator n=1 Tax=Burkholderia gladioli TaxID=28095 RepID=UPI00285FD010|nr:transcriptional regulator [Burkholderia gladioli]MDR8093101.1 transcriptional regulator [Burkholderia gladioli]
MYNQIFFTNVLRLLDERGWTKHDLSTKSDVSISFVSDMTNGKANPSLETMEKIAQALETPLPLLLEHHDLDSASLELLIGAPKLPSSLPKGYERVSAVLPSAKAFVVRKWDEETRRKLREES